MIKGLVVALNSHIVHLATSIRQIGHNDSYERHAVAIHCTSYNIEKFLSTFYTAVVKSAATNPCHNRT
jgi:hypothetical protein